MTEPIDLVLPGAAELLEHSQDLVAVLSEDAAIVRVNDAFIEVLGQPARDLLGEPFTAFVLDGDRESVGAAAVEAMASGASQTVFCQMIAGSGERRTVDWLLSPWGDDRMLVIGRDVTERTAIGRRVEAMLGAIPDVLIELDRDGRCLSSHGGGDAAGFELVEGEPVEARLPEELGRAIRAALSTALSTGEVTECLYQGRDAQKLREWECRITPVGDGSALALLREVTEARAAERGLLDNFRALDDSAQAISHNLREPLVGMRHLMRYLADLAPEPVRGEADKYLGLMEHRLDRMDRLLRGLRRYVRIGAMWPPPEAVALGELIPRAIERVRRRQSRLFEVSTHIESGAGELVTVGRALESCLVEVIDNAVLHHDRDRCRIDIRVGTRPGARRLEIVDDGPGIGEDVQPRIFDLFSRFGDPDSDGLGLAIVRRILTLCHGEVEAVSPVYDRRGTGVALMWPEVWPRAGGVR